MEREQGSPGADLHPTDNDLSVGTPAWRREGPKVPQRQKPRGRLWLNDGCRVRVQPQHRNHVWSYDFMSVFTHDGRTVRFLNLIDEYTRECLAIHVGRRINSNEVIEVLAEAMIEHGIPEHIRSDNGSEFVAKELRKWLAATGPKTLYVEPSVPCENGYCESFNSRICGEFLNGEILYSLQEVRVLTERWRVHFNTERPHSSLGYRPPAPAAWQNEASKRHGKVESKERLPLSYSPDGGYLKSKIAALHSLSRWYKLPGRPRLPYGSPS